MLDEELMIWLVRVDIRMLICVVMDEDCLVHRSVVRDYRTLVSPMFWLLSE